MITWRNGTVSGTRREWPGAVELDVSVDGAPAEGGQVRALAFPALTGRPRPGDRVLVNTTALDLGLGTGGYALVIALPDRLPPDPELAGHLIKARYSPLQACVLGADEQGSPHHDVLRDADDIGGMPVVVADLHSALPAVLAGIFAAERSGDDRPPVAGQPDLAEPRVVYVMQDGGALPAWFSRTCAILREAGWLAATVTTGQSFGGDLETAIMKTIDPESWEEKEGPGSMTYVSEAGSLVIRQTSAAHEQILQLLRDLREAKRAGPAAPVAEKVDDGI
jgi:hypothetical protein